MTTYYVDYTGGSDSYDGTHETFTSGDDGPWKTINKVNNSTFVAGDNILFKRGEVWRSELLHLTDDGSSGSPITVDAYGIGARPIISWSIDLSSAGDWESEGNSNVWKTSSTHTSEIGWVLYNGDTIEGRPMSALANLYDETDLTIGRTDHSAGDFGSDGWANQMDLRKEYFYSDCTVNTMSVYCTGQGGGTGNQVAKAVIYAADGTNGIPYTRVGVSQEVTVTDGQAASWVSFTFSGGVHLTAGAYYIGFHWGANSTTIQYWRDYGPPIRYNLTDTYADGPDNPASDTTPTESDANPAFYASYTPDSKQGYWYYDSATDLLYVYSVGNPGAYYENIECTVPGDCCDYGRNYQNFRNIHFRGGQCGIQFSVYDAGDGLPSHNIIEYCYFTYNGSQYGNWPGAGGAIGLVPGTSTTDTLDDVIIRYNYFHQSNDSALGIEGVGTDKVVSNIYFHHNILYRCGAGIGFGQTGTTADGACSHIHIDNNTMVETPYKSVVSENDKTFMGALWFTWSSSTAYPTFSNCSFRNNIVMPTQEPLNEACYAIKLYDGADELSGWTVDNNCYYPDASDLFRTTSSNEHNLSGWKTAISDDANSISSDPQLLETSTFRLHNSSPCIEAGVAVSGITDDFLGNAPDIGAVEADRGRSHTSTTASST